MSTPDYRRICIITLIVLAVALPAIIYGSIEALESNVNSPSHWVPETFEERQKYEQFVEMFESGDLVVIGWPGCDLDDARLDHLAHVLMQTPMESGEAVEPLPKLGGIEVKSSYFSRVITGYRLVRDLTAPPLDLPKEEVIKRLKGTLIGPDGHTTCAVVLFTREGVDNRIKTIEWLEEYIHEAFEIPLDEIYLAGPIVDGASVDKESARSLSVYGGPSAVLILLLGWWCLKSLRVTLIIFILSQYSVGIGLALVYYFGDKMNAVLIVMPPLLLVVGMAGGVHLVNYYYDAVQRRGFAGASHRAMRLGWLPCTLSAGTTAMGLSSLIISEMVPIKLFGTYSSIGVMAGLALLFLLVPGWLQWWPPVQALTRKHDSPLAMQEVEDKAYRNFIGRMIGNHYGLITMVAVALMVSLGWGIQWVKTSVKIQALFEDDSRIINDYRWLEDHVAPLVTVEVLLHFAPDASLNYLERMELLNDVQQRLAAIPEVGGTMSAATFAPPLNVAPGLVQAVQRAVLNKKLEQRRDEFVRKNYLYETDDEQIWRITARVEALNDLDYGEFLGTERKQLSDESTQPTNIRDAVEPVMARWESDTTGPITATYTGLMPLVYKSQNALVSDLFKSFLLAFVMVTVVMVIVLAPWQEIQRNSGTAAMLASGVAVTWRGLLRGLVAMISNLFPTVLLFGFMGWIGRSMDIGSVMTASVALGMAVDGTLHFLTFFRRELHHGATRRKAVESAFHHCAAALSQTFLICGLGLLVFALSDFVPTNQFAWMMLALLFASLIGNLIVLPSLLVGPLGTLFNPRPARPR